MNGRRQTYRHKYRQNTARKIRAPFEGFADVALRFDNYVETLPDIASHPVVLIVTGPTYLGTMILLAGTAATLCAASAATEVIASPIAFFAGAMKDVDKHFKDKKSQKHSHSSQHRPK